jgi:hypothetical protein
LIAGRRKKESAAGGRRVGVMEGKETGRGRNFQDLYRLYGKSNVVNQLFFFNFIIFKKNTSPRIPQIVAETHPLIAQKSGMITPAFMGHLVDGTSESSASCLVVRLLGIRRGAWSRGVMNVEMRQCTCTTPH